MITKQGRSKKCGENDFSLTNANGDTYAVSFTTALVWDLFDGSRSKDEVVEHLFDYIQYDRQKLNIAVDEIITGLKKVELLEEQEGA